MDSSWDNTLYASALGMCVHSSAMRRQLHDFTEFVFREDGMRGVVSVVSVGAEGKTVLLAEFARSCVENHPNWNIYDLKLSSVELSPEAIQEIIDYIRQRGIGKIRRTILLLDAPAFYVQEEDGTKRKVEIDWEKIEEIRAKERMESLRGNDCPKNI